MKSKNAVVRLTGITHMMGAKDLFEDVNMEILGGQVVGLVGPNGVGKSTLLKIIAGRIEPRAGTVEVEGDIQLVNQGLDADLSMSVCEYVQVHRDTDDTGPLEEREISVALSKTGGKEIDIHMPLSTLSGGERTRLRLAKCLLDKVDILLLDEPTNHLDRDGIAFLQGLIKKFRGIVVIVSHDRQFLDDVCTDIFDLRRGAIEMYEGTYTQYIKERTIRYAKHMREREEQQQQKEKAEKSLDDLLAKSAYRGSTAIGKTVRARKKFFDRRFIDGKIEAIREDNTIHMSMEGGVHQEKQILTLGKGVVGWVEQSTISDAGDTLGNQMNPVYLDEDTYETVTGPKSMLFRIPETLKIYGHDRIVIVGENGTGKTTLLKLIHHSGGNVQGLKEQNTLIERGDDIRIGWFDQHDESLVVDERVMKWCLRMFPAGWDQEMITHKLGDANIPEEDLVKKMSELSYGQRMKIRFLQLMLHSYDLLVLDEPTNHLDIGTREELEGMVQQYQGALLVVSHDRWFVQQIGIVTKWRIRNDQIEVLPWTKKYSNKGK